MEVSLRYLALLALGYNRPALSLESCGFHGIGIVIHERKVDSGFVRVY